MIKIGVTGVIGSGKSTAVKYFSSLGVPVFIADNYAKKLMNEDVFLKSEIIKLIGDNAYQNNELNRQYISDVIFKDEKLLKFINDLVHPKVREEYAKWLQKQDFNYCVYEAALIFENKSESDFDKIICIKTPIDEIYKRLKSRKNYSKFKIDLILNSQIDQDVKCSKSDYCINNTSFKELEKKILEIHSLYV
jgi:dephospho-CoA kinase